MGLEANILCHHEGLCFEGKALLESHELILRGALKLRVPLGAIKNLHIRDDCLVFEYQDDEYALELGKDCEIWRAKILAPPKTLSEKLGIKATSKIFKYNDFTSDAVNIAIGGENFSPINEADLIFIQAISNDNLARFLDFYFENQLVKMFWVIHPKGKKADFKENDVRLFMRSKGFMDNKISGVDGEWSATRFCCVTDK
jgi:hypothetical protein